MALRDTIRRATAAVVPRIISGLAGSTVDTTRFSRETDAARRASRTPFNPLLGSKWFISELADARRSRVWGDESAATAEAMIPIGSDVEPDDVVEVISGDFAGSIYEIEQRQRVPLGNMILVALAPTQQIPFRASS